MECDDVVLDREVVAGKQNATELRMWSRIVLENDEIRDFLGDHALEDTQVRERYRNFSPGQFSSILIHRAARRVELQIGLRKVPPVDRREDLEREGSLTKCLLHERASVGRPLEIHDPRGWEFHRHAGIEVR
jgi:hypothetical protein